MGLSFQCAGALTPFTSMVAIHGELFCGRWLLSGIPTPSRRPWTWQCGNISTKDHVAIFGSMAIYGWGAYAWDENTYARSLAENVGWAYALRGVYAWDTTLQKNLGLIQPELGCFQLQFNSSCSLAWSTLWLMSLKSSFVYPVTQVWMLDLWPSKHNLHISRYIYTWIL